jgi:hypothetical protein
LALPASHRHIEHVHCVNLDAFIQTCPSYLFEIVAKSGATGGGDLN